MSTGSLAASDNAARLAFEAYERVRHRFPQTSFPDAGTQVNSLLDLAGDCDVFLLDGFGVLNVGGIPIDGVAKNIDTLQAMGKQIYVVTNGAGYPLSFLMQRYRDLGYNFLPEQVVSSRQVMLAHLPKDQFSRYGVMAAPKFGTDELPEGFVYLEDDPKDYEAAEAFLMLGASAWNEQRQGLFVDALKRKPRPVYVGNPDMVAPVEGGLSREPGEFAHALADATGITPEFHGKPFPSVFDLVRSRLQGNVPDDRIVMVGDTLHTDIFGGRAAGFRTALVTGFGVYADWDHREAIARSGIVPDYTMHRP